MQVVDVNGNMFGYDHLEIIGADGRPKTLDSGLTSVGLSMPSAFTVSNSPLTSNGTIGVTGAGTTSQYIDGTGSLRSFPSLTGYVPYVGATQNVDLGEYQLKAGQIEFDQTPTGTPGVAIMRWNDQDGTVDLGLKGGNVTLQIGQEQLTRVVNKTGGNLLEANYQSVRISGAQGNRLKVALAQANNDANSAETLGIVTETINDNQEGFITTSGLVRNINTTGSIQGETWADGDMLYLSGTVAGQLTNIKPTAPIHTVIMGYVVRAHATQGQIYVKVDNGYELDELHNVAISSPINNQGLFYETATQLWKNKSIDTALGYTPVPTTRQLTINGTTYDLSANRTWSVGTVTSVTASAPLSSSGGNTPNITISQASSTDDGYLSAADWTTFNSKQPAGNYITALSGEASGSGPGTASVTLNNASVTAKVLTGVNITGGSINASDSILTAFGKLQNQINGLIGSSVYQGTWNASTNTPALASGVGTRGYYYIVSVAGSTNLDGITDWNVGDWAIFDGTAWQQVDNTDSVTSVNGQTGAVSLTTDNIPEGATNLYFTNLRARQSLSLTTTGTSGAATYNNTTGVLNIPQYQSVLTNPVTGTGTANYVARWTSSSQIGTGVLYDDGSYVGIGTSAPDYKLDIRSNTAQILSSDSSFTAWYIGNSGVGNAQTYYDAINGDFSGLDYGFVGQNNVGYMEYYVGPFSPAPYHVFSSGNVGIGTTAPSHKLSVVGGINTYIQVNNGSSSTYLGQLSGNGVLQSDLDLTILSGGSERIRVNASTGNVGIGTSSPAYKLTVAGRTYVDQFQYNQGIPISGTDLNDWADAGFYAGSGLANAPDSYGWYYVTVERHSDASWVHQTATSYGAGNTGNRIYSRTKEAGSWTAWKELSYTSNISGTTNYVSKFTSSTTIGNSQIFDNGTSVGVGTASPSYKLDVSGDIHVQTSSLVGTVYFGNNSQNYLSYYNTDSYYRANGNHYFEGNGFYKGVWDSNAYLGIGNTNPTQLVDIGPTGAFKTLRVRGTYNFDGSYLASAGANGGAKLELVAHSDFSTSASYRIQHNRDVTTALTFDFASPTTSYAGLSYVERMRIDANGNVGIGTSNPTSKLTVDDSTAFSWGFPSLASAKIGTPGTGGSFVVMTPSANSSYESGFAIDGTYTGGKSVININAFGVYSGGPYSADIAFKTSTNTTLSEKMRITSAGNVGIGTNSPSYKLDIVRTGAGIQDVLSLKNTHQTVGVVDGVRLNLRDFNIESSSTYGSANNILTFGVGTSKQIALLQNGNVGIGTTNPSQRLEINGNIKLSSTVGSTSTPSFIWLGNDFSNGNTRDKLKIYLYNSGTEQYGFTVGSAADIQYHSNGTHNFFIGNTFSTSINSTGIGIGTSTPSQPLHVNGSVRVAGAYYDSNNQAGTSGQILSSTGSGTDWVDSPTSTATSVAQLLPSATVTYNWVGSVVNGTWVDIFTRANNVLTSGVWTVTMYVSDFGQGGAHYQYRYSGTMTWYQGGTNQTGIPAASEIALHRMGHAANDCILYLRTTEEAASDGGNGKLQIKGNYSNTSNTTITFTFVKII